MKSFQNTKIAKLAAIGAAISLFSGAVGYAAGEWENIWVQFDSVNLKVNGQNVTSSNLLYNDRTYVPLRACAEMLGSTVGWDQNTNTASIQSLNISREKAVEDLKTANYLLLELNTFLLISESLYSSYSDCVAFYNYIVLNDGLRQTKLEEIWQARVDDLNEIIEDYNKNLNLVEKIDKNSKQIGLDFSKINEMAISYGNCIDNLKQSFESLYSFLSTKEKQYSDKAIEYYNQAFKNMDEADTIAINYRNQIKTYVENYK